MKKKKSKYLVEFAATIEVQARNGQEATEIAQQKVFGFGGRIGDLPGEWWVEVEKR